MSAVLDGAAMRADLRRVLSLPSGAPLPAAYEASVQVLETRVARGDPRLLGFTMPVPSRRPGSSPREDQVAASVQAGGDNPAWRVLYTELHELYRRWRNIAWGLVKPAAGHLRDRFQAERAAARGARLAALANQRAFAAVQIAAGRERERARSLAREAFNAAWNARARKGR